MLKPKAKRLVRYRRQSKGLTSLASSGRPVRAPEEIAFSLYRGQCLAPAERTCNEIHPISSELKAAVSHSSDPRLPTLRSRHAGFRPVANLRAEVLRPAGRARHA